MIKKTDLRIGNYFTDPRFPNILSEVEQLHTENIVSSYSDSLSYEVMEPTPITEDILYLLGWRKAIENDGKLHCFKKGDHTIAKWVGDKWQFWYRTYDFRRSPQFVHELQNRYYSDTGYELLIK